MCNFVKLFLFPYSHDGVEDEGEGGVAEDAQVVVAAADVCQLAAEVPYCRHLDSENHPDVVSNLNVSALHRK